MFCHLQMGPKINSCLDFHSSYYEIIDGLHKRWMDGSKGERMDERTDGRNTDLYGKVMTHVTLTNGRTDQYLCRNSQADGQTKPFICFDARKIYGQTDGQSLLYALGYITNVSQLQIYAFDLGAE